MLTTRVDETWDQIAIRISQIALVYCQRVIEYIAKYL